MVLGVGHHDTDPDTLERLAAHAETLRTSLVVGDGSALAGVVVLATCNRLEVYVDAVRFHDALDAVAAAVAQLDGHAVDDPTAARRAVERAAAMLSVRVGRAAATHLFTVAAGLDAMVVGEVEIAGQVARTYREAAEARTVTPALHALFQAALGAAKAVAAHTDLGAEGRSVADVALSVATERIGSMAGRRAVLLGTGAFARVLAAALRSRGCTDLQVYSATGRAAAFAATHGALPVGATDLPAALATADIVVAASGRGHRLPEDAVAALHARTEPVIVIDLALEHDIPADVRALDTVGLIDLRTVAAHAGPAQGAERDAARAIVAAAVDAFDRDQRARSVAPAVVALRSHVATVMDSEVQRLRRKYDAAVADDVQRAMHRVTNSLLHAPSIRARELATDGNAQAYLTALHTLFGIDVDDVGRWPTDDAELTAAGEVSPHVAAGAGAEQNAAATDVRQSGAGEAMREPLVPLATRSGKSGPGL